jgi:hypothetical protein
MRCRCNKDAIPRWGLSVSPRSRYFSACTETLTAERFTPHGTTILIMALTADISNLQQRNNPTTNFIYTQTQK